MGLLDRDYMRRKVFDDAHPWVDAPETSSPKHDTPRFTIEVTREEYERINNGNPPPDGSGPLYKVTATRRQYEQIYRQNPAFKNLHPRIGQQPAGAVNSPASQARPWLYILFVLVVAVVALVVAAHIFWPALTGHSFPL